MQVKRKKGVVKREPERAPRARPTVPRWLWMLVMGLFFAMTAVVLYLWQPWYPTVPVTATPSEITETAPNATENKEEGHFQFYDLLPQQKISTWEKKQDTPAEATQNQTAESTTDGGLTTGKYVLQIDSLTDVDAADKLRSTVMVSGVSAKILVSKTKQGTWYRVYSGPYANQAQARQAQKRLTENGIISILSAFNEPATSSVSSEDKPITAGESPAQTPADMQYEIHEVPDSTIYADAQATDEITPEIHMQQLPDQFTP